MPTSSTFASRLVTRWKPVLSASVTSGSSSAGDSRSVPGLTTSRAPANVMVISVQRARDTFSSKPSAEISIMSSGVSMMMAVSSPSGM